jgi:DNA-directed RNA polymerase specialized sigma subunit
MTTITKSKSTFELKSGEKKLMSRFINDAFSSDVSLPKRTKDVVMENFPLAIHVAKKYVRPGLDISDLVQIAALGLIKAAKKFNPRMNKRFANYAVPTIDGEIRHYVRDFFYGIKISRKAVEINARIQRYKETFMYRFGREATPKEISQALKISLRSMENALQTIQVHYLVSLDAPVASMNANRVSDVSRLEDLIGTESRVDCILEQCSMDEALNTLEYRDRLIIKDRFVRDLDQTEIAERYGITQAQVSRIIKASCEKLAQSLN